MRHISWIVTLPLMLALVVFSLANRGEVSLDLWPFNESVTWPLSWLLLIALFVGLLAGGTVAWLSGAKSRRRARELRFDKAHLEREVIRLRREAERAKSASVPSVPSGPSGPSALQALPPSAGNGSGRGRPLTAASAGR